MAKKKEKELCSGYRVFPDGTKCKGCSDCDNGKSKKTIAQVFKENHSLVVIGRGKIRKGK